MRSLVEIILNVFYSEDIDRNNVYVIVLSSPSGTYYTDAGCIERDLDIKFDFTENYRGITIGIVCKDGIYKIIPSIEYKTFRVEHRQFITEKVVGHINEYKNE